MNLSYLKSRVIEKAAAYSLSRDAKAIRSERLTYLSARKLRRLERALARVVRGNVPGDIVEFGVALGGSAVLLAKRTSPQRRFYGLDVFSMIPEPTSEKDDATSKERYRTIAAGKSEGIGGDTYYGYRTDLYEHVSQQLKRHGTPVDGQRVHLVRGLFENTWPTLNITSIAFAHIDCDWYDPVRFCLRAVAEKLSPNGMVVIDDYHDYKGCRQAVDEFLGANPEYAMLPGSNPILYLRQGER
ncbi:MAG: asparagine synthase [Alphaproteobacteria bacterium]|nr:asparagine synthase [Alphaproteobacteria bacterium]